MAKPLSPIESFLAPLTKLALKHPEVEAEVIWANAQEWEPQSGTDALLEAGAARASELARPTLDAAYAALGLCR